MGLEGPGNELSGRIFSIQVFGIIRGRVLVMFIRWEGVPGLLKVREMELGLGWSVFVQIIQDYVDFLVCFHLVWVEENRGRWGFSWIFKIITAGRADHMSLDHLQEQ